MSQLLRHQRPFLAFWFARVFTASGFQMITVAIGWQMYSLTGNVLDLGLVGLIEFLPKILFILLTGHVADRFDRRKVAALCQGAQGLIALGLLLGSSAGSISREMIFVIAFLLGTARAFEMPTTQGPAAEYRPAGAVPRCCSRVGFGHAGRHHRCASVGRLALRTRHTLGLWPGRAAVWLRPEPDA